MTAILRNASFSPTFIGNAKAQGKSKLSQFSYGDAMKALVLSAGPGEEMRPLTGTHQKTLLRLQGCKILEYVLEGLNSIGIDDFVVVTGYWAKEVSEFLSDWSERRAIPVEEVAQGNKIGVEGAILAAEDKFSSLDTPWLLAFGDIVAPNGFYHHILNTLVNTGTSGTLAVTLRGSVSDFGLVALDEKSRVVATIQRPPEEVTQSHGNYVMAGAAVLPPTFFEHMRNRDSIDGAIEELLNRNEQLSAAIWDHHWTDIGYPWDLLSANRLLFEETKYSTIHESASISATAQIQGLVVIEEGVEIDHHAVIRGPVYIGKNAYIGTSALIRDHTAVEHDCMIGYACEIKNSVIQPHSTIGRLSFIGDSVVGEGADIRSGVTTHNELLGKRSIRKAAITIKGVTYDKLGAIVGRGADVGPNTVVMPTGTIEPGEIVSPSSVVPPTAFKEQ
ncbi:MAG: sugar phosphate nucleotidyltransferase [Candidatus Hodarchaeales archaeon]